MSGLPRKPRLLANSEAQGPVFSANVEVSRTSLGKTLVLTKSEFTLYRGAFYQFDFLEELSKAVSSEYFGPGFPDFDPTDSLDDIIAKLGFVPDTIIVAHMWLDDNPLKPLDPMPNLDLRNFHGFKVGLLNKEYSRLREKLDWFSNNRFDVCFSHSHVSPQFAKPSGPQYHFLPFGVSERFLSTSPGSRRFDLGFTGVLQNPTFKDMQNELRFSVMRELFHTWRDVPFVRKRAWREFQILWRSWSGDKASDQISRFVPWRRRLSPLNYERALRQSKVWLNTISPAGLVSTRYLECMAAGSLVLTEKAPQLNQIFPEGHFLEFASVPEFRENLIWAKNNPAKVFEIAQNAREVVSKKHLWKFRIRELIEVVEQRK